MSLGLELPCDLGWSPLGEGGICLCTTGWPQHLLPSFLCVSVKWTCLGYFLTSGTTLHLRVEVRCMHHTEHDWLELWKRWWLVVKCMLNWWIFVCDYGIFYYFLANHCQLMFWWFFYNKFTIAIFVSCGWYLWRSRTFVCGSKWTTINDVERNSFVGAAKPT